MKKREFFLLPEERIEIAMRQVENVINLIEGNEYEQYMNLRLTSVWYELKRQKSLLTGESYYDKVEESNVN